MTTESFGEIQELIIAQRGITLVNTMPLFPDLDREKIPTFRGKVRDNFNLGDHLLMVATDRISTFDAVHPNGVPGKGILLTQMSLGWFDLLNSVIPNHLLTANVDQFPLPFRGHDNLRGRSMLVARLDMVPIECVVRGYLTGSGLVDYQGTGSVCGIELPEGIVESQKLPEPIFTPATKEATGHDVNISFGEMCQRVGFNRAVQLRYFSLALYEKAVNYALQKGVIIADTKFEFGLSHNGNPVLGDEVLTPDSSRFWDAQTYQSGKPQPSFDKQYVRDWATSSGWNKEPPAPELPQWVTNKTLYKYIEAYCRLFWISNFQQFLKIPGLENIH